MGGKRGPPAVPRGKTLARVSSVPYAAGDTIRFMKNRQFSGMLTLHGNGTIANKITVDSYGSGSNKPVIMGSGITLAATNALQVDSAIMMVNLSWWTLQNIEVQAPLTNGLVIQCCDNIAALYFDFTNIMNAPGVLPEQFAGNAICPQTMD